MNMHLEREGRATLLGIIVLSSLWLLNCELWPYSFFFPYFSKMPTLVAGKVHSLLIFLFITA